MLRKIPEYPKSRNLAEKNQIFNYFLIQEARELSKNHPRVRGFYHTKSQAESSYGELSHTKFDFWPGQDVLAKTSREIVNHPAYLEVWIPENQK